MRNGTIASIEHVRLLEQRLQRRARASGVVREELPQPTAVGIDRTPDGILHNEHGISRIAR